LCNAGDLIKEQVNFFRVVTSDFLKREADRAANMRREEWRIENNQWKLDGGEATNVEPEMTIEAVNSAWRTEQIRAS
jgi:hypothetical protein